MCSSNALARLREDRSRRVYKVPGNVNGARNSEAALSASAFKATTEEAVARD
jgi:hypothetical protein